jgi:hypothetical protein
MTLYLMFERHSPENCPMFNEKNMKVWTQFNDNIDGLSKKHGIKMLGSWTIPNEHLTVDVIEAPSFEALTKLFMEPALLPLGSFESFEIKAAFSSEEIAKMMASMKK